MPNPRLIPQVSPTNKVSWGIGGVFGKSQEHGTIRANLSKLVQFINKIHDFPELTHSACLYCTRAGSHSFDMRTKIPWHILSYTYGYFLVNFGAIWKFCLKVPLRSLCDFQGDPNNPEQAHFYPKISTFSQSSCMEKVSEKIW